MVSSVTDFYKITFPMCCIGFLLSINIDRNGFYSVQKYVCYVLAFLSNQKLYNGVECVQHLGFMHVTFRLALDWLVCYEPMNEHASYCLTFLKYFVYFLFPKVTTFSFSFFLSSYFSFLCLFIGLYVCSIACSFICLFVC